MSEVLTTAAISEGALGDEFTVEASIFPESAGESLTNLDLVTTENEESELSAAKEIATSVGQIACGACVGCPFFNQCVKPQAVAMKQELADQEELTTDGETDIEEGLVANVADFMPKQSYLEELLAPDDMDEVRETGRGEVIMAEYQAAESQMRVETVQSNVKPKREKVIDNKLATDKVVDELAAEKPQASEVNIVGSDFIKSKDETVEPTIVSHNDLKEVVIDELQPIELDPEITFIDAVRIEDAVDVQLVNDDEGAIHERSLADLAADDVGGTANDVAVEKLVAVDQREESLEQFEEVAYEMRVLPNAITMVEVDLDEEFANKVVAIEEKVEKTPPNVVKKSTNIEQEKLTIEEPPIFINEPPVAIENAIELEAEFSVKASNSSKNLELAPEKPIVLATAENRPLKRDKAVDDKAENFTLEKAETNQNLRVVEKSDDKIKDKVDVNLIDKEVSDVFSGDFSIVNTAMKSVEKKSLNCEEADGMGEAPLEKDADMIIDNHPEAEAANKGYGLSWLVELVGVVAVFATIGGRSRGLEWV